MSQISTAPTLRMDEEELPPTPPVYTQCAGKKPVAAVTKPTKPAAEKPKWTKYKDRRATFMKHLDEDDKDLFIMDLMQELDCLKVELKNEKEKNLTLSREFHDFRTDLYSQRLQNLGFSC